ncbi:MAG: alkaline phosphatase family protein [Flavisolibacter sp.]
MAVDTNQIKTVILVMMENRSFDHLLGHLSLTVPAFPVNGLKAPVIQYNNIYNGTPYPPFSLPNDDYLTTDVPHEYNFVATQLDAQPQTGRFRMRGFVKAYADAIGEPPNLQCDPMKYFTARQVPMSHFLATRFCTCDRWFSPLPTSTQPNRTIAFCGDSPIYRTETKLIDVEQSIFKWMEQQGISWRVYHEAFSFFTLYPSMWKYVLSKNFKRFPYFMADMQREVVANTPQVIIVEPCYQDAPHFTSIHANDNHAPLSINWGEQFLRNVYLGATVNPEKWAHTVMVIYYDEHGGFYDHEPPPKIPYSVNGNDPHEFNSMGPRIPGIIVSPFVSPGKPYSGLLDHTSVLQFLAEVFKKDPISKTVTNRKKLNVTSILEALQEVGPLIVPPIPPSIPLPAMTSLGASMVKQPDSAMMISFEEAGNQIMAMEPDKVYECYPELYNWKVSTEKLRPLQ